MKFKFRGRYKDLEEGHRHYYKFSTKKFRWIMVKCEGPLNECESDIVKNLSHILTETFWLPVEEYRLWHYRFMEREKEIVIKKKIDKKLNRKKKERACKISRKLLQ